MASAKIKTLIVDDSAFVRNTLSRELALDDALEIVGSAPDPYAARDMIVKLSPDVITLDIEMPRMDGLSFLKKLMHYHPIPVVIVSSLAKEGGQVAMEAMDIGAVDVMCKPSSPASLGDIAIQLADKVKAAALAKLPPPKATPKGAAAAQALALPSGGCHSSRIVLIGASTGGTQALESVLTRMPKNSPPFVIVQHMPERFTALFAQRLDKLCQIDVKEAEDGDQVLCGRALIAPGNFHTLLKRGASGFSVQVKQGPLVCRHRPSVDVLFKSASKIAAHNSVALIMTGMGADGAEGMLELHNGGAKTLAQNEKSCIVYGMPREAVEMGAVDFVVSLDEIPQKILELACEGDGSGTKGTAKKCP